MKILLIIHVTCYLQSNRTDTYHKGALLNSGKKNGGNGKRNIGSVIGSKGTDKLDKLASFLTSPLTHQTYSSVNFFLRVF